MANFNDVEVFDGMSLSDLFKKIHKQKARERFIECYLLLKLKTK